MLQELFTVMVVVELEQATGGVGVVDKEVVVSRPLKGPKGSKR